MALDDVPQRIADEQRLAAGGFQQARKARVVAREHRDPVAFRRHLVERAERNAHVYDLVINRLGLGTRNCNACGATSQSAVEKNSRGPRMAAIRCRSSSSASGESTKLR